MNLINKNKMKAKMFFMILAASLFAAGCGSGNQTGEHEGEHEELPPNTVEMNDAQIASAGIELGSMEHKMLSTELKVNGVVNVSPQNLVSISAIMGGYIKSTGLVPGSPVSKGQVIAVIENPEFIELQRNYLESKSKLEYAETEYNRQKDLYKENVSSAKTYQLAVAEYKTLQSTVFALEQKLKMIGIDAKKLEVEKISGSVPVISPISGYVKTVSVNVGKYVNATDVIVEIVNTKNLTLELTLFEKDIDKVMIGQQISFNIPTRPENKMTAVIYQVGKAINTDKTIKVYATVEKEDKNLLPGMYINATIDTRNDSVSALPDEAVLSFDDKNYIFIFYEKKPEGDKVVTLYKVIEVKKGVSQGGYTEVILPEDVVLPASKIVIRGAYNLLSAMKNAGDMAC
ncbi:MAG: efflux RND transporter periplasmic adaptor subunit [Bacteroidales bacterium]|jgi:cobalt-zinc-cadmium efflux system membrane fusion protein|nr:efflux RND transporter periplasmic adaptor subunit [Bacteroidales bacterium]